VGDGARERKRDRDGAPSARDEEQDATGAFDILTAAEAPNSSEKEKK